LNPIQERRAKLREDEVEAILDEGSQRAFARAEQTMVEVRAAMKMPA
jgi:hypothetical protein